MTELTQLIEKKMKIKLPNIKIPYLLGMFVGYGFDFHYISEKSYLYHQLELKNFVQQLNLMQLKFIINLKLPIHLKKD